MGAGIVGVDIGVCSARGIRVGVGVGSVVAVGSGVGVGVGGAVAVGAGIAVGTGATVVAAGVVVGWAVGAWVGDMVAVGAGGTGVVVGAASPPPQAAKTRDATATRIKTLKGRWCLIIVICLFLIPAGNPKGSRAKTQPSN